MGTESEQERERERERERKEWQWRWWSLLANWAPAWSNSSPGLFCSLSLRWEEKNLCSRAARAHRVCAGWLPWADSNQ